MELARSQQLLLQRLKVRGPQSVKILARQLEMTTMGARQHLADLLARGYVMQTRETRQNRGRPVHLWELTARGHQTFTDGHALVAVELIDSIRQAQGETGLDALLAHRITRVEGTYREALTEAADSLEAQLQRLAELRTAEGYMAEIRLLPDGWLLIEHHCPIHAAASRCQQFCGTELDLFRRLLAGSARVERVDHLLAGARRCAFKITPDSAR